MDKVNMVPGFILKLWNIINDQRCDNLISWSDDGQSFIIQNQAKFSQELSKYFKHNNLSSFIRQLNMYGFRKVVALENSGLHQGSDDLHFFHPDFVKNKPDRLEAIKRKLPQKVAETVDLNNVIKGIAEIEDKQSVTTKTLSELRRENEMLWAELRDLRHKHEQQQLYISGLMKLMLAALEQNGVPTNMLKFIRNQPLMIEPGTKDEDNKTTIDHPYATTSNINPVQQQQDQALEQQDQAQEQRNQEQQQQQYQESVTYDNANYSTPVVEQTYDPNVDLNSLGFLSGNMEGITTTSLDTPVPESQQSPYLRLQENIEDVGDQIDILLPQIMDFDEEEENQKKMLDLCFN